MPKAAAGHPLVLPPWRIDPSFGGEGQSVYVPSPHHRVPASGAEPVVGTAAVAGIVSSLVAAAPTPARYGRRGWLARPPRLAVVAPPYLIIPDPDAEEPGDTLSVPPDYTRIADEMAAALADRRVDVAVVSGFAGTTTGSVIPPVSNFNVSAPADDLPGYDPLRVVGGRTALVDFRPPLPIFSAIAALAPPPSALYESREMDDGWYSTFSTPLSAHEKAIWPALIDRCDRLDLTYLYYYEGGVPDAIYEWPLDELYDATIGGAPNVQLAEFNVEFGSAAAGTDAIIAAALAAVLPTFA